MLIHPPVAQDEEDDAVLDFLELLADLLREIR
jgi:hypothetical protein